MQNKKISILRTKNKKQKTVQFMHGFFMYQNTFYLSVMHIPLTGATKSSTSDIKVTAFGDLHPSIHPLTDSYFLAYQYFEATTIVSALSPGN